MKSMIAALISTVAFGTVFAQTPGPSPSPNSSAAASPSAMANSDAKRDAAVEKHIKVLHAQLNITAAQEAQWKEVAATMRENAQELDRAIDKRVANAVGATAVADLNAYADIAQAHADGVKKLANAFSSLYAAMTDDQKKEADDVFSHRRHEGRKVASR